MIAWLSRIRPSGRRRLLARVFGARDNVAGFGQAEDDEAEDGASTDDRRQLSSGSGSASGSPDLRSQISLEAPAALRR